MPFWGAGLPNVSGLLLVLFIVMTLVLGVTALSLGLSFALPGHIELIAVIFVTNLPLLFSSTAPCASRLYAGMAASCCQLKPLNLCH